MSQQQTSHRHQHYQVSRGHGDGVLDQHDQALFDDLGMHVVDFPTQALADARQLAPTAMSVMGTASDRSALRESTGDGGGGFLDRAAFEGSRRRCLESRQPDYSEDGASGGSDIKYVRSWNPIEQRLYDESQIQSQSRTHEEHSKDSRRISHSDSHESGGGGVVGGLAPTVSCEGLHAPAMAPSSREEHESMHASSSNDMDFATNYGED